jgi:2-polyprenyl-3-methyl-5-hydroxy-6-metoxy-1,4-benzoquinol methylase
LSDYCLGICKQRGLQVIQGDVFDKKTDDWCVQGVHMSHVLEHLKSPREALLRVHMWLRPEGLLYLEVPHQFDGWLEKIQQMQGIKSTFSAFSLHHCSFFSPESLLILLDQCGFEVNHVTTFRKERHFGKLSALRSITLNTILTVANIWRRGDIIGIWAKAR